MSLRLSVESEDSVAVESEDCVTVPVCAVEGTEMVAAARGPCPEPLRQGVSGSRVPGIWKRQCM